MQRHPPTNGQLGCGSVLYNFASQIEQPVAYYSVGFYFQDEYRVNSKLKLTMTLRADRNSGGVCQSELRQPAGYAVQRLGARSDDSLRRIVPNRATRPSFRGSKRLCSSQGSAWPGAPSVKIP